MLTLKCIFQQYTNVLLVRNKNYRFYIQISRDVKFIFFFISDFKMADRSAARPLTASLKCLIKNAVVYPYLCSTSNSHPGDMLNAQRCRFHDRQGMNNNIVVCNPYSVLHTKIKWLTANFEHENNWPLTAKWRSF